MKLSERLLAGEGPDREIDLAISVVIDYRNAFEGRTDWEWAAGGDEIGLPRVNPLHRSKYLAYLDPAQFVPRWTASLDAALTLYLHQPDTMPTNPRKAAAEALEQRGL